MGYAKEVTEPLTKAKQAIVDKVLAYNKAQEEARRQEQERIRQEQAELARKQAEEQAKIDAQRLENERKQKELEAKANELSEEARKQQQKELSIEKARLEIEEQKKQQQAEKEKLENEEKANKGDRTMSEDWIEEEITFQELDRRFGIEDLDTPEIYDILEEGYEILSFDHGANQEVWKPLEAFVVKKNVSEHYQLNTLHGTADHKVFFNGEYVRLADHPGAEFVNQPIQVVDCQVADTHNYFAEGQINHNTTTPGGSAIPYATNTLIDGLHLAQYPQKDELLHHPHCVLDMPLNTFPLLP
jgi:hypothetical protein